MRPWRKCGVNQQCVVQGVGKSEALNAGCRVQQIKIQDFKNREKLGEKPRRPRLLLNMSCTFWYNMIYILMEEVVVSLKANDTMQSAIKGGVRGNSIGKVVEKDEKNT